MLTALLIAATLAGQPVDNATWFKNDCLRRSLGSVGAAQRCIGYRDACDWLAFEVHYRRLPKKLADDCRGSAEETCALAEIARIEFLHFCQVKP